MPKSKKKNVTPEIKTRLLNDTTPFAIREAFNHLRTNLMYTLNNEEGCPIFAVTSAGESAGKSTLIANVALSYAKAGKKVLLIDADMRASMQYRIFGLDKSHAGLSELLSGIEESAENVVIRSVFDGLDLLLAGLTPPNPSELIMSARLEQYLGKWRLEYDAIFIDFPPVDIVTDTLTARNLVTGYIFVVRSEKSDARKVSMALDAMNKVNAKILGVVLNDVNAKSYSGGYSYRKSKYSNYANPYEQH